MALLRMILRKMLKNRVFILFLAIGLLISAALLSAIPMYTNASLEKLLIKDMEGFQVSDKKFPGSVLISENFDNDEEDAASLVTKNVDKSIFTYDSIKDIYAKRLQTINSEDKYTKTEVASKLSMPILSSFVNYSTDPRKVIDVATKNTTNNVNQFSRLESYSNFDSHIKLIQGRLPKELGNNNYEVMASDDAINSLGLILGKSYQLVDGKKYRFDKITVTVVGIYQAKNAGDVYWSSVSADSLNSSVILEESTMLKDFVFKNPTQVKRGRWYYAFDYHSLNINSLNKLVNGIKTISSDLGGISQSTTVEVPSMAIMTGYNDKKAQITTMMWSINVPVIVTLCLYMFMVSGLIIQREKNEISLLTSRGAGKIQVVIIYLIEGLILGVVAIIIGPLLGYLVCKVLGSSSGFLEFVDRKALNVFINFDSYIYVLFAIFIFILTLIIPAYRATESSIVDHKRKIGRKGDKPVWEKFYFDIILLIISGYEYYAFNRTQAGLQKTGVSALEMKIDPMNFLVPVLFILGIGLLFLRIYPLLIRLISFLGRKYNPPTIYTALTQVGRAPRSYDFLMIFLILTLAVGIFGANSARTINQNAAEKIKYKNGADMVITNTWKMKNPPPIGGGPPPNADATTVTKILYFEPSFEPYKNLKGIQAATKVFQNDSAKIAYKNQLNATTSLMAIDPYDFGKVAWFRNGLLSHHINEYLNLLAKEPTACLISQSVADAGNIKVGDSINLGWNGNEKTVLNVYGIIKYWPTWNPNGTTTNDAGSTPRDNTSVTTGSMLVVANLPYIQSSLSTEPYEVWLKTSPGATSKAIYQQLIDKSIVPSSLADTNQELIQLKNDPAQLAFNGSLTMGFLISGIICFMGFVLYWVLSLKSRSLQFGLLRAMGLTSNQLKLMILWEQIITSGVAMFMGVVIGLATSYIFVPFFQMSFGSSSQVPPFVMITNSGDLIKVYCFIGFTVILGLGILIYQLSRIKISNVIKLGED